MNKKVLIFGTFDLLHPGHLKFLKEAYHLGRVIVVLTPDLLCQRYKGLLPVNAYKIREARLNKLSLVNEVISADKTPNSYHVLARVKPDIVLLGYDQKELKSTIQEKIKAYKLETKILVAHPYRATIYKSILFRQATK